MIYMIDALIFISGMITMGIVWFVHDMHDNPYIRGYEKGLHDGIQEVMKDFNKIMNETREGDL